MIIEGYGPAMDVAVRSIYKKNQKRQYTRGGPAYESKEAAERRAQEIYEKNRAEFWRTRPTFQATIESQEFAEMWERETGEVPGPWLYVSHRSMILIRLETQSARWKRQQEKQAKRDERLKYGSRRQMMIVNYCPEWANNEKIKAIYAERDRMNIECGQLDRYEVDHVIPVCHDLVCGLHVPENLQIVTKRQNRSKSNKFKPG